MPASIKNSLFLISEKVILLGLSFINSILLARLAGPELFGEFSYIVSFAGLTAPLTIMGLNNIITKYIVKHPKNSHYYIKSALIIRAIGSLFAIICTAVICYFFINMSSQYAALITLLVTMQGFTFLYVIEFFYIAKQQVSRLIQIRVGVVFCVNTAKLIAILNSANLTTLIVLQGFETLLIGMCYFYLYRRQQHSTKIKRQPSTKTYLALCHKGKWLFMSGLAAILYLKIDQIMLANYHGNQAVAYYAAAVKLSEFWYVFPVLIANVFTAQLSHQKFKAPLDYQQTLKQLIIALSFFAICLSVATFWLATPLINLLYGDSYSQSASILSIHVFASIFIFQRAVLSKWLIIEKLYKYSLVSNMLGAITNIILNMLLIPKYQGVGAAWATLISYMVASYGFLFINAKTQKYAHLLHQAMLNSPRISIQLFNKLKAHYEKSDKKTD